MEKKEKIFRRIIKEAIDLHVHIGPEVMPRKYTLDQLIKSETGKLGGVGIKSHFFPTAPFLKELVSTPKNFKVIGSIALNNSVGGLNAEAVRAAASISNGPIIVWFPTISARNYLDKNKFEIRPEWVKGTKYKSRLSKEVKGLTIIEKGKINSQTTQVLEAIKELDLILATGHISWQESRALVEEAVKMGIKRIIITHPIYQLINMPIKIQIELAKLGAFIEIPYSMYSLDGISIEKIAEQIKFVGVENVVLSSDVGQISSKSPSESLLDFLNLLNESLPAASLRLRGRSDSRSSGVSQRDKFFDSLHPRSELRGITLANKEGLGEDDFYKMLVENPKKLLFS